MLRLYNTLGRKIEVFNPAERKVVTVFTCGPSVYQRAHIGNFRTFMFEDLLVRYLEYSGYSVIRGMNFTDLEDKAIRASEQKKTTLHRLTERNTRQFLREMRLLGMKVPQYLPRASESIQESVGIIEELLRSGVAYRFRGNIYFDPLKFPGFGRLYGLDMSRWPSKKRRFHKDTYPGVQWNLGDFILWHGYLPGERYYWETSIGRGRPSWNIQDPAMISKYFDETLSIYCGGIDNLYRHHDYTLAVLESVRPYPMAKYWLHCNHLFVNGQKMSKSKGNILYTDDLKRQGCDWPLIRFLLIYRHYRERINFSDDYVSRTAEKLIGLRNTVRQLEKISDAKKAAPAEKRGKFRDRLTALFAKHMDNDLNAEDAFDELFCALRDVQVDGLTPAEARDILEGLKRIDEVLGVIF